MIRRHAIAALAIAALGLVVTATAEAGGTAGAVGVRKDANVIIRNTTTRPYYVLLIPGSLPPNVNFGTPGSVGWARRLGATIVSQGASVVYPVPAGSGGILVYKPSDIPSNPNAQLPDREGAPATGGEYTVVRGSRITKKIVAGPAIE
jgi:hypothetical protein